MAYHQPGDKTEAIYVSNLKGDNTKFYRFFRVAELGRQRKGGMKNRVEGKLWWFSGGGEKGGKWVLKRKGMKRG